MKKKINFTISYEVEVETDDYTAETLDEILDQKLGIRKGYIPIPFEGARKKSHEVTNSYKGVGPEPEKKFIISYDSHGGEQEHDIVTASSLRDAEYIAYERWREVVEMHGEYAAQPYSDELAKRLSLTGGDS